jgi:hypothetical protein
VADCAQDDLLIIEHDDQLIVERSEATSRYLRFAGEVPK